MKGQFNILHCRVDGMNSPQNIPVPFLCVVLAKAAPASSVVTAAVAISHPACSLPAAYALTGPSATVILVTSTTASKSRESWHSSYWVYIFLRRKFLTSSSKVFCVPMATIQTNIIAIAFKGSVYHSSLYALGSRSPGISVFSPRLWRIFEFHCGYDNFGM
jgi:hypothetical protein